MEERTLFIQNFRGKSLPDNRSFETYSSLKLLDYSLSVYNDAIPLRKCLVALSNREAHEVTSGLFLLARGSETQSRAGFT